MKNQLLLNNVKSVFCTFIVFISISAKAQITINSTSSTPSTCPNNGTITVNASNASGNPMLYSIIAGPVSQPEQNSNVFTSLPKGTYTVRVNDAFGNANTQVETITGNYQTIAFNPKTTSPTCLGGNDGEIEGNLNISTGKAPFTWEIISPSVVTRGPQSSELFQNLPSGSYTVRLTDDCAAFDTRVVSIYDENIPFNILYSGASVDCSETEIQVTVSSISLNPPYTISATSGGSTIALPPISDVEQNKVQGKTVTITQIIPGLSFGDDLVMTVTDGCGQTSTSSANPSDNNNMNISPFGFSSRMSEELVNCNKTIVAEIKMIAGFDGASTRPKYPIDYTLRDKITNQVITNGAETTKPNFSVLEVQDIPPNGNYTLDIEDACGNTSSLDITSSSISTTNPPTVTHTIENNNCLDSTSYVRFRAYDFTDIPRLVILSGPNGVGSTKEGFEYSVNYSYPDTLNRDGWSSNYSTFQIRGFIRGTYQYKVIDDCGNDISGTLVVGDNDVVSLSKDFYYSSNCTGKNTIYLNTEGTGTGTFRVTSTSGFDQSIPSNEDWSVYDSINNVPPGMYTVTMNLRGWGSLFGGSGGCQQLIEKFEVIDYEAPKIYTHNVIACKGAIYAEIIADSLTGNPPYEFEIISGPQTFPRQTSNIFPLTNQGIYRIRIYDDCGNASTSDITVGSASLDPQSSDINCSSAHIIYPASGYYAYQWTTPNNTVFNGDSLILNSITTADTGEYRIRQVITINGCSDTTYNTHTISSFAVSNIYDTICPGDSYLINGSTYTTTGVHTDTVSTASGCDSLVQLHLFVKSYLTGSYTNSFCQGGSLTINGKTYSSAGTFYDTLSTTNCDSIVTINLTEGNPLYGSVSRQICAGGSITVAGDSYNAAGVYNKTIFNGSCDSLLEITITQVANIQNTINQTICEGDTFSVGGSLYTTSGKYVETINTPVCDSIVTTNLQVVPLPTVNLGDDKGICQGDDFTFDAGPGFDNYIWNNNPSNNGQALTVNSIGEYFVKVTDSQSCSNSDTVYITDLYPTPLISVSDNDTICSGNSTTLNASGGFSYTWQPGNLTGNEINISPLQTTNYSVTTTDQNNCTSIEKNVLVVVKQTPTIYDIINDNQVILGTPVSVNVNTNVDSIALMDFYTKEEIYRGMNKPIQVTPSKDVTYQVTVDHNGCEATKEITISVLQPISIAEVFTPNGDGANDFWVIRNIEDYPNAEVALYNRWGNIVLKEELYDNTFDGTFNGDKLPNAVYYYVIKLNFNDEVYTGYLTLLR